MGFVKLPDLTGWAWYNDNDTLLLYIRLRMEAKYKPCDVGNIHLERGQLVTTVRELAESNGFTIQHTKTLLTRLTSTNKITITSTPKISIITLLDYDCESESGEQATNQQQTESYEINKQNNKQKPHSNQVSRYAVNKQNNKPTTNKEPRNQQTYFINDRKTEGQKEEIYARARTPEKVPEKSEDPAPVKRKFAEFVSMTNDEWTSLVAKLGEQGANRCVEILDNYKGQSGKHYKNDYRAILNWVVERYRDEQSKLKRPAAQNRPTNGYNQPQSGNPFLNMLRDLDEREGKEIDVQGNAATNGNT